MSDRQDEPATGQFRRQVMLGTEALYRICAVRDELVDVEVVRAPALRPGERFALTRDAVGAMDLVTMPDSTA